MSTDRTIAATAHSQHGLCTLEQLRALDILDHQVEHRIRSGELQRRHAGVFAVASTPRSWEQDVLAACLAAGPCAVASHRAAARLHRIDLRREAPVEVMVPRGRLPRLPGAVLHRSKDLVPAHVVRVGPIPTTNVHRLLVDLGAVVPAWAVSRALEQLVMTRRVTPSSARSFLETVARRGRDGAGILRQVLDERALGERVSDSPLEEMMARLCRGHGLPTPSFQHPLTLGGRQRRLDFAYPDRRIAIEVDGYAVHTLPEVFEDDRVRGNELEVQGWVVLRFTFRQLRHRPWVVASTIRDVLGSDPRT